MHIWPWCDRADLRAPAFKGLCVYLFDVRDCLHTPGLDWNNYKRDLRVAGMFMLFQSGIIYFLGELR